MTAIFLILYLIPSLSCFIIIVLEEKKQENYIEAGVLLLFTTLSLVWPATLLAWIIVSFYKWLEKVINK